MTPLRRRMIQDMQLRNYALNTQKSYVEKIELFAKYFDTSPERLGLEEIRRYQMHLVFEKKVSISQLRQFIAAARFLYRRTLRRDWSIEHIGYPRRDKKLPEVLTQAEMARVLCALSNHKHRTILMTMYAAGLRVSEVVALLARDIDSQRMVIAVRRAKGRKDRYVMLSARLLKALRDYWKVCQPAKYLFPSRGACRPMATRTVYRVVRKAATLAGVTPGGHVYAQALLLDNSADRHGREDLAGEGNMGVGIARLESPAIAAARLAEGLLVDDVQRRPEIAREVHRTAPPDFEDPVVVDPLCSQKHAVSPVRRPRGGQHR